MRRSDCILAHSLPGRPESEWETLEEHAERVAAHARSFASAFGAAEWGELLGRWHDIGKGSAEFQQYLRVTGDPDAAEEESRPGRIDHSTFGAQHAAATVGRHTGQLLAFCIAGHHGSLPDATSDDERTRRSTLRARLAKAVPSVPLTPVDHCAPQLRLPFKPSAEEAGFQIAFFTRMIYSALIDADRTATEKFCNPQLAAERGRRKPTIAELRSALEAFLHEKQLGAERTTVNRARARILTDALTAAELAPGFFSLHVPTGGGKTYSSLAFGLRHAQRHGLRRVIVAIPFTSIIEQTADAYRQALGAIATEGLVEHHSDVLPERDTRHNKLAAENWDAPLIVTTNVQLYESLFAARGTACRKLHRIARSVIVLDEAQTIPVELLRPTLLALRELVRHYGCTVVLCTATQPALTRREGEFPIGLEDVRPIVHDPKALFDELRRVDVAWLGRVDDRQLVERLAQEPTVLCVVNTRKHAASLYEALAEGHAEEECHHLSTLMCAKHRRDVLNKIRERLRAGLPCRLVSTQLIEAGVDVDFPVVYRASAGFDSIAQAAGRCNREGKLRCGGEPARGRVYVFEAESLPPPGLLRGAAQCGRELAPRHGDPTSPEAIEDYFRLYYWSQEHHWDRYDVLSAFADDLKQCDLRLNFRTGEARYSIIRDEKVQLLVPYDDRARALRERLWRTGDVDFALLRDAQPYLVGVHDAVLRTLDADGVAMAHESGLWLLVSDHAYCSKRGLDPGGGGVDPLLLIQ